MTCCKVDCSWAVVPLTAACWPERDSPVRAETCCWALCRVEMIELRVDVPSDSQPTPSLALVTYCSDRDMLELSCISDAAAVGLSEGELTMSPVASWVSRTACWDWSLLRSCSSWELMMDGV